MDTKETSVIVQEVVRKIMEQNNTANEIPVGVSARHCHLCKEDLEVLFGQGYELIKKSPLSQPGQFAANETVTIAGPKGSIERVRILGPLRGKSQVEVSKTDTFKMGLSPPVRQSGDIEGSSPVTLVGPKGSVYLEEGLIIAQAHIHMSLEDKEYFEVEHGDKVTVVCENDQRSLQFKDVVIRASSKYKLEMHIDTDEANAALIQKHQHGKLIKQVQP